MKRDDETTTQFWVRQIQEQARRDAIQECVALLQRWSDEAAEFIDSERCTIQANVCRNAAQAIRNLALPSNQRGGENG